MKADGMLLFINVALGLALSSGINSYASHATQSDVGDLVLVSLFMIFALNAARHFLGFVKFYGDETLRQKVGGAPVYALKIADFVFVFASSICLYLMGSVIGRYHDFAHYLFFDSGIFLVRDLALWGFIPVAANNADLIKTFKTWMCLDAGFCVAAAALMYTSAPSQLATIQNGMGFCAAVLVLLTILDVAKSKEYYFG